MRVISGVAKGRRLKLPKGSNIRPTLDKIKEALFNILGQDISGKEVLELFAGSGALGIEALSRGAERVTFVDSNLGSIRVIKENLKNLNFMNRSIVLNLDVRQAISYLERKKRKFDLILADPPYGKAKIPLKNLAESDILKNHFIIVIEHYKKDSLVEEEAGLRRIKLARYGDTLLSFYKLM
jgi:16S rRNA (guanine966-N2)-methyltransferase